MGAHPGFVFLLLMSEAAFLGLAGVLLGIALLHGSLALLHPAIEARYGLFLSTTGPGGYELALGAAVVVAALVAGAIPAWRGYRNTLADGLTLRV